MGFVIGILTGRLNHGNVAWTKTKFEPYHDR